MSDIAFDLQIDESATMDDLALIEETKEKIAFSKLPIGAPFFAIGTFWIKMSEQLGMQIGSPKKPQVMHNFAADPAWSQVSVVDVSVPPIRP